MTEAYKVKESKLIEESQQVEKLLLEACDSDTRALLRLADISILACGRPSQPTLTVSCKSREVTEAIGLRQAYIKTILLPYSLTGSHPPNQLLPLRTVSLISQVFRKPHPTGAVG